jgi:methylenetetrahydrofolate reductase (NADPH)
MGNVAVVPGFELICEIEPPTRPSLTRARHQIGVLSGVADGFLVPDNHLGRATVSSVAVAHEVAAMGGRAIACLNSRDRNVLGFRRDLLTAAAYGVGEFLLVYGDRPESGRRSDDVSVRRMMEEIRAFGTTDVFEGTEPFRIGVASRLDALAPFKRDADFVFSQVSYSLDGLLRWRESLDFAGQVYAGIMVLASPGMARKLSNENAQLSVPSSVLDLLDGDANAGVQIACELAEGVRTSGAFDGVHLVPVSRYREVALLLEQQGWRGGR